MYTEGNDMTRADRAKIAQETVKISKQGMYVLNGVEKRLINDTQYLLWEQFDKVAFLFRKYIFFYF